MAITYASGVFTASGANTDADLKAIIDANPSNGMYEGGAAIFKAASLSIPSGATVTTTTGTVFVFDDSAGWRMNLASGGTLDFKFGGGITYNGSVQHSFFNGKLNGKNIVYRINASVANGRSDFFAPGTSSDGIDGLTLVFGGGADGYLIYTHLENLAGKITNLKFVNDVTTSLGGAGSLNVQFGNGTYAGVTMPKAVSNYGITTPLNLYLARSGGNTVLTKPTMFSSQVSIVGDTSGTAELIDEVWPDMAAGTVGSLAALGYNGGNTAVSRKITWTPGTFVGWNVYIADSRATPVVAQNGLVSSSAGILLTWALYNRNPSAQVTYGPFRMTARKRGFVEQDKTFSPVQPITESFVPEVDSYYTSDRSALTGISAVAATKTITITAGTSLTLDAINDWVDWWLEQPAQLASVPQTFKSNAGTAMSLGDWSISNAGTITAGVKLKSFLTTGTVTGAGTLTAPYQDASGLRASISGLDPSALGTTWVLGWITTANYNARNTAQPPAAWTGWAQSSGTGNSTTVTLATNTEYQLFLRIPGYFAPVGPIATINTATQSSVVLSLVVDVDIAGSLLWPQTAAHTAQAAKFTYNSTDQIVEYANTTGATDYVSFLAAYRALETIAKAPAMAYMLIQPLYLNGTKDGFALPRSNPLLARMSAASTAAAILEADIAYADNQAKAFDRFRANGAHAYLLIPQASAALSGSTISAVGAAARTAIKPDLVVVNNGIKKASNIVPHTTDLPA